MRLRIQVPKPEVQARIKASLSWLTTSDMVDVYDVGTREAYGLPRKPDEEARFVEDFLEDSPILYIVEVPIEYYKGVKVDKTTGAVIEDDEPVKETEASTD